MLVILFGDIMMLNLIKVKFLGGGGKLYREFGREASPLSPPLDETLQTGLKLCN